MCQIGAHDAELLSTRRRCVDTLVTPMNHPPDHDTPPSEKGPARARTRAIAFVRLARPHQWSKGAFVLVGPLYALSNGERWEPIPLLFALIAFCLGSSGCYVFNDLADVQSDRRHPRKSKRPIASGRVGESEARVMGVVLLLGSLGSALLVAGQGRWWVLALVGAYIVNVMLYSAALKHIVIVDVLSLSSGFVLRVLGGCAAAMVAPSTWLLNVTLFLSMFLAFGKRLGERRVLGTDEGAAGARGVQRAYSDQLLRMMVVVTGVASLLTYTGYVQSRVDDMTIVLASSDRGDFAFNVLWITVLPVMLGLLRTITVVMEGRYDDPTELAMRDRGVRWSVVFFVASAAFAFWAAG